MKAKRLLRPAVTQPYGCRTQNHHDVTSQGTERFPTPPEGSSDRTVDTLTTPQSPSTSAQPSPKALSPASDLRTTTDASLTEHEALGKAGLNNGHTHRIVKVTGQQPALYLDASVKSAKGPKVARQKENIPGLVEHPVKRTTRPKMKLTLETGAKNIGQSESQLAALGNVSRASC